MENTRENRIVFWLFLAPVLFAFLMVVVIPFFLGIFYSFTDWSSSARAGGGLQFVGLENFSESLKDPSFLYSFLLSFIYTGLNVLAINIISFALALMVTSAIKGRNLYRVGFFLPNLIGGLILGYVWQFIFNNALPGLGEVWKVLAPLAEPENLVLAGRSKSVLALVVVGTWQYAGYIMMIYVAALESVPVELHEAARIDGASAWHRLKNITVPMVAQAFTITLFLTLVNSFKQFDVNVSLTNGGPSTMFMGKPIFGTELLALDIYRTAFVANNLAQGQARAFIFFIVLVIISILQVRTSKKREIEL
ncbi:MAG: sugar ABC transporter permease [Spirochaetaceae bacterium]|nr:sugar ABC transporter permease [Spirochaetaceae bacterium]